MMDRHPRRNKNSEVPIRATGHAGPVGQVDRDHGVDEEARVRLALAALPVVLPVVLPVSAAS